MITKEIINAVYKNTFRPTDLSSLFGWYDFTTPSTVTLATGISQINDQSGVGNHLVQATGGSQPSYTAYGGLRDLGYASFTSGKTLAKTGLSYAQPFTVFMVCKQKSFTHQATILRSNSGTNGALQQYVSTNRNCLAYVAGSNWWPVARNQYYQDQVIIYGLQVDGGAGVQTMGSVYFDDTIAKVVSGAGTTGGTLIQIGDATSSPNFDMYEVLYFNTKLTKSECLKVYDYLEHKYNPVKVPVFVNFGDSLTVGNGSATYNGFNQRVATAKGWQPYNFGINGGSLISVMRYYSSRVLNGIPLDSWISISFGSNDFPIDAAWNTSCEAAIVNLLSYGFNPRKVLLITPPYSSSRVAKLTALQGYWSALAAKYGLIYVDCVTPTLAGGGNALLVDGSHPSDAGYQVMADAVLALL